MTNATELLPCYGDSFLPDEHPLREEAERVYRNAYLCGAQEASQWLRPEIDVIAILVEQREIARDNARVERDGVEWYVPGHEILAARLRGRHHALAFVEQAWSRPEAGQHHYHTEMERWLAEVERWAAEPIDFDERTEPPRPDDTWPPVREETPMPEPVVIPSAPRRIGNLEWLRTGEEPVFASAAKAKPKELTKPLKLPVQTLRELVAQYPELRPPVVHGLVREGETMNVIASPKTGKSWLVSDLALAVATGRVWLDTFPCEQGRVLIVDNELHKETSAHRIPKVMAARGITLADVGDRIEVANLRGELKDIFGLGRYFAAMEPGQFKVVILDAFYRFMPKETDENDNASMAQVYNVLDAYAARLQCAFVLIHHSTKGNQSGKSVTDVGAGAGAQSRAADTHLVLRPHEEPNVAVLDAAVRSWPPIEPRCLRWSFPVWTVENSLDPAALKTDKPRRKPKPAPVEPAKPAKPEWDAESFAASFVTDQPAATVGIIDAATQAGLSEPQAKKLLRLAEAGGHVHRWTFGASRPIQFATTPQPKEQA